MVDEALPSPGALAEVARLAGPSARIDSVIRLRGGQHAATWRVNTTNPALCVVVRRFPIGDRAAAHETRVLGVLDGLGGLAPTLLGGDLDGRWSPYPTTLISWCDGEADITPADPERWAIELGRGLARVHRAPAERLAVLPLVVDGDRGSQAALSGPLAARIRPRWQEIAASPEVLTHSDYWSGNVVWRDGSLSGIVDWSGAARGPRGFDVGWCRLDLHLLFDERIADVFLAAYEDASRSALDDIALWDGWAIARSHDTVTSWEPNYLPLGRADLDPGELRRRHSELTRRLLEER